MKISLGQEAISSLISPKGSNDSLVQALQIRQYQKTLAWLSQIKRQLVAESEELVVRTGFIEAFTILSNVPRHVQKIVLSYPSVGFWLDVAWDLISRQSHIRFPEMHVQMHLEEFWRIALAAGYLSKDVKFSCMTWSDENGNVFLPGTGIYLSTPSETAYQKLFLEIDNGKLTGEVISGKSRSPIDITHLAIPKIIKDIELNAVDNDLHLPGRTDFEYEQIGSESEIKWQSVLEQAWEWITQCSPLLAQEILLSTQAIVPVVSESVDTHISATFREAPGLMALSWTPDASVMVEAVVHEYHHQKLNALMNLDSIIEGPTSEARFYSPWRRDPRPLTGLLHGAYVFQAVLEFWTRFFDADIPLLHEERVRQRMYLISKQVEIALDSLTNAADLSPIGEMLIRGMYDNLALQSTGLLKLSGPIQKNIDEKLADHASQWEHENSHLLASEKTNNRKPSDSENLQSTIEGKVLNWLDLNSNFDLSLLTHTRYPIDPFLSAIISAYNTHGLDELIALLRSYNAGSSLILDLINAHIAYVQNDYLQAAVQYDYCLINEPTNPYFWECFAFAIRHLAHWDEAELILTNLGALTTCNPESTARVQEQKHVVEARIEHVKSLLGTV